MVLCPSCCTINNSRPAPTNLEIYEILDALSMPKAIELLKAISSNHPGMAFNEIKKQFGLSSTDTYEFILPLTRCGLIFYSSERYRLNPLGRGALEAINILEDAVNGEDIVVYDISHPKKEKVVEYMDSIARN